MQRFKSFVKQAIWFTLTIAIVIIMGCFTKQDSTPTSIAAEATSNPSSAAPEVIPSPSSKAPKIAPTPVYGFEIVNTYPHDRAAFTQGLFYDQGELYEGTGLNGASSMRRVELETGKILQIQDLDSRYFGEGLALWDDRLIQLTWRSQVGFIYDRKTFQKLGQFTYRTEGWGLTQDGQNLIMSDGSNNLYFLDPNTFGEVKRISVQDQGKPIERLNELEYIKGEIFANVWLTDRIVRISPTTGEVLGWIDCTGLIDSKLLNSSDAVLNGIAYDAEHDRLFVTGKFWPQLFEIKLVPIPSNSTQFR